MKLLFVHSHPFYVYKNNVYTSGTLDSKLWNRYLRQGDTLRVVGRGRRLEAKSNSMPESSHPHVTFDLIYDVNGGIDYILKSKAIRNHLKKAIRESDFIIVRLPSVFGEYCADLCQKMKIPYVAEVVGCSWDSNWNYGGLLPKIHAPLAFFRTKKAVKNSLGSIYVTEKFLQKRYPCHGSITSFASNVTIDDFPNQILSNHIELLQNKKQVFHFGLIGNLEVKYKGFETAMRALALVKQNSEINFKLNLIGGGSDVYIKELVKKYKLQYHVNVIGLLSKGEEVYNMLDTLDLYIHPSKQEGLPRSVIEAMSRGCPVLASTVAGIPELLKDKYLHKPGDYKTLSKQIIKSISNIDLLKQMSEENFEKSKEYTSDLLSERRNEFWSKAREVIKTEIR